MTMTQSLKNHFLIAMPSLQDSHFHHSVVYVCEHTPDGAMGIIINQPTELMIDALLDHVDIENQAKINQTTPVLFGGPVNDTQGMVLHNSTIQWPSSLKVSDSIQLTTSIEILDSISKGQGPNKALITLGYSGWEAGQLETEITENSWLTVESSDDILFTLPANERWHAAAELLGVDIDLLSPVAGHS
jgi:putative transcriptional regulator